MLMKRYMQIVYLIKSSGEENDLGFIRKVIIQKKCLQELGCSVEIYSFDLFPSVNEIEDIKHISLFPAKRKTARIFKYYYELKLLKKAAQIIRKVKPHVIYMRDYFFLFNFYSEISKIAPLFVEVETNVFGELKTKNYIKYLLEVLLKRRYFKSIKGMVCITNEILSIEREYNNKPALVLGNGIENNQIKSVSRADNDEYINILFIATPNQSWQGVERLIESYENAVNKDKFKIHIVGYESMKDLKDEKVIFYGYIKDKDELEKIYSAADIGIGTLCLYKKHMKEAAPLKVRSYLAKGIPAVIGYEDTDLGEELPFVYKVKNDSSLIDFVELEKFFKKAEYYRKNNYIFDYAVRNLSWGNKMKKVLEFIEKSIDG
jgi:glycosyltransferase involved in cell wall biosynthesis